tara:strand:- start:520 stop:681 length:162 start_codon:yes stop_codon:yes gene_type:complete
MVNKNYDNLKKKAKELKKEVDTLLKSKTKNKYRILFVLTLLEDTASEMKKMLN